jgi:hypothetical protein
MRGDNIYYLEITISFKKGKSYIKRNTWAVSKHNTAQDIMKKDPTTMFMLNAFAYGNKYKSAKQLVITKIISRKIIGKSVV